MAPHIPSLSDKERIVLELLTGARQMYGLELVSESDGALKRGTVYVTLGRMEEKGYIASRQQDSPPGAGGLPRRLYSPTPLGREMLRAWTQVSRRLAPSFAR